jgi:membrane protease YdiL (CAAX protease family)
MRLPLLALFLVVAVVLVLRAITRDRRDYAKFKQLTSTIERQKTYRKWLIEGFLVLGGLAAAVLLAAFPSVDPVLTSTREWGPIAGVMTWLSTGGGTGVAIGIAVVLLLGLVLPVIALRGHTEAIPTVGDVGALLPRTREELPYTAALSINAGVVEEVLFRLGMPALVFGILGNGPLAFLIAAIVFGLLHLYQGPVGVAVATVLGLAFTVVYVATGSIAVVIVLHALVDLRSLVLIPVVVQRVHRTSTTPNPPTADPPNPANPPSADV